MDAMADTVSIQTGDALAIRRLLWDVGARVDTPHDLKIECLHWASALDRLAGMPPWPTPGDSTEAAIQFYERMAAHLDDQIQALRSGRG